MFLVTRIRALLALLGETGKNTSGAAQSRSDSAESAAEVGRGGAHLVLAEHGDMKHR